LTLALRPLDFCPTLPIGCPIYCPQLFFWFGFFLSLPAFHAVTPPHLSCSWTSVQMSWFLSSPPLLYQTSTFIFPFFAIWILSFPAFCRTWFGRSNKPGHPFSFSCDPPLTPYVQTGARRETHANFFCLLLSFLPLPMLNPISSFSHLVSPWTLADFDNYPHLFGHCDPSEIPLWLHLLPSFVYSLDHPCKNYTNPPERSFIHSPLYKIRSSGFSIQI